MRPNPHLATLATIIVLSTSQIVECTLLPREPKVLSQEDQDRERRNTILIVHAVCGFLAFQIFAPLAVVVASVGRSWGPVWFKIHYRIQLFVVLPLAAFAVGLGASATTYDSANVLDKHKVLGFVLLGVTIFQMLVGLWAHMAQKIKRDNTKEGEVVEKRRMANWVHIFLGIAILSLGGLQVTWGLGEWDRIVGTVPAWIRVVHWAIAGVPVLIVTPYVLIRGLLRMRRGQTFAQAFFDRPTTKQYTPPRKLFLGSSTYRSVGQDEEKDQEYEGLIASKEGETGWVGATSREEYEVSLQDHSRTTTTSTPDSSCHQQQISSRDSSRISANSNPFDATSSAPTLAPSPSIYPPSSLDGTPYINPDFPTSTMSPLSLPIFSPPPQPTFSPRLAFMPFSGTTVVNPPAPSTVATSPSTPRDSTLPSIRSNLSTAHERQVVVVPSPPTCADSPRPLSVSTSTAATCNGELSTAPVTVPFSRQKSMSGEIVGISTNAPRIDQGGATLATTTEGNEEEEETGKEGSSQEHGEAEEDVAEDDESTRLMDELERELTISSTRSRRIPGRDDVEEGTTGVITKEAMDEAAELARSKSGEWFAGGKRQSQA